MPFGKGAKGEGVKFLQQKLDSWIRKTNAAAESNSLVSHTGLIGVIPDGSYGQNTTVALAAYQSRHDLSPSGYADATTLQALGIDPTLEANGTVGVLDLGSDDQPPGTVEEFPGEPEQPV